MFIIKLIIYFYRIIKGLKIEIVQLKSRRSRKMMGKGYISLFL